MQTENPLLADFVKLLNSAAGTFADSPASFVCSNCPVGTYSDAVGASIASTCFEGSAACEPT